MGAVTDGADTSGPTPDRGGTGAGKDGMPGDPDGAGWRPLLMLVALVAVLSVPAYWAIRATAQPPEARADADRYFAEIATQGGYKPSDFGPPTVDWAADARLWTFDYRHREDRERLIIVMVSRDNIEASVSKVP